MSHERSSLTAIAVSAESPVDGVALTAGVNRVSLGTSGAEQVLWLQCAVLAACLIYVYPLLLPTPLLEPDEGLHAAISQEMLEHSEWILPTFQGQPFLDKPIFFFWAQMLSLKSFGMNEFAVRLPGLLFGLLGALTTALLARQLSSSDRVARYAFAMSLTLAIPASLAQAAAHDVALVPWTNLSLLCLWKMERCSKRRSQLKWMAGAAVVIGLAALTKALIGIALVGVAFGLFLVVGRQLSLGSLLRTASAFIGGCLLASPWFIAMEACCDGYLYYYFVERHLLGYVTSTQSHGRASFYYYLPYMLLGTLPWGWYLLPFVHDEWRNRRTTSIKPSTILLGCWLIGGLSFLSVAKSKLVTYALPLFPAVAILAAMAWDRMADGTLSHRGRQWFTTTVNMASVAGILAPIAALIVCQQLLDVTFAPYIWLFAISISAVSIVTRQAFEARRYDGAVGLLSVWMGLMFCLGMTWPLQLFAQEFSERDLADWLNKNAELPQKLVLVGEDPASLLFYLNPDLRQKTLRSDIHREKSQNLAKLLVEEPGVTVAVTRRALEKAEGVEPSILRSHCDSAGQFLIYETEDPNHPAQHVVKPVAWEAL